MTTPWYRTAFGAHYPVIYAHRDEAEAARCLELLDRLAPLGGGSGRKILDLGCGDGRHLVRLSTGGSIAVGLDLSADLLRRAAGRGTLRLVRGDMLSLPFLPEAFTAVLSLFTAFGYFSRREENLQSVKEISRIMVDGGHWFLDYLDGDRVRAELAGRDPVERDREAGPLAVSEVRTLATGGGRVIKDVRLRARPGQEEAAAALGVPVAGLAYRESVALFTLEELDLLAGEAGLIRTAAAGGYDGRALGEGDRWILVYRKEGSGGAPRC